MRSFFSNAFLMYVLNGLSTVVLGAVLPAMLTHYHASYVVGGQIMLFQFIGFLAGVGVTSFAVHRIGHRATLLTASAAMGLGELVMGTLPPLPLVGAMCFLNGFGLGAMQTTIASSVMEWYEGRRAVVMSRLEVAFGLGALLMPLFASRLLAVHEWPYAFSIPGALALVLGALWLFVRMDKKENHSAGPRDAESGRSQVTGRARLVVLALFLAMTFLYVGIESALNGFLPAIFMPYLHQSASAASLTITVFWTAMVLGRMLTGRMVRKVPYAIYLLWSISMAFALLAGLTLWRDAAFFYVMIFLVGLAMSGIYALILVFANHMFAGRTRLVTSLVTAAAGLGGAALPVVVGWLMDELRVVEVIWSIAMFTLVLLAVLVAILRVAPAPTGPTDAGGGEPAPLDAVP